MTMDSESTRPRPMKSVMSKVWLTVLHDLADDAVDLVEAPHTGQERPQHEDHESAGDARATESRNEIFIADHGSTRETVRRTRRADAGRGACRGPAVAA